MRSTNGFWKPVLETEFINRQYGVIRNIILRRIFTDEGELQHTAYLYVKYWQTHRLQYCDIPLELHDAIYHAFIVQRRNTH